MNKKKIIPKEYVYIIPSLAFGIELEYDKVSEEHGDAYQGCWFHLKRYLKIRLVQPFTNAIYISYKYVEFRNILALC